MTDPGFLSQFGDLPDDVNLTPLVLQEFVWDISPHTMADIRAVCRDLELSPGSEEVMELAHRDCHIRHKVIEPIYPLLQVYSAMCAQVWTLANLRPPEGHEVPSEDQERLRTAQEVFIKQTYHILSQCAAAIVAQLVHAQILVPGPQEVM